MTADWMGAYADDYTDLDFDVERHREAFRSFAALGISQRSARPALIARELVMHIHPGVRFFVGVTTDVGDHQRNEILHGCAAFAPLYHAGDSVEADGVRSEVWSYFQRHFPGRCIAMHPLQEPEVDARCVYIAFFNNELD